MANVTLTLQRGTTTATKTWLDTQADPVLQGAAQELGYTGSLADGQAMLDYLHKWVRDQIVMAYKRHGGRVGHEGSTGNLD